MNYDKYIEEIHQKYIQKVQYVIDVTNSCNTWAQLGHCRRWARSLFLQWRRYEDRIIDDNHGGYVACKMAIKMYAELSNFIDMFNVAHDRKKKELARIDKEKKEPSKNEEN